MTKFGTWARHAKHYENTVKFKWSTEKGHKDMRRSNTKTSNISRQHHLVVKFICRVGNRGRQSKRQGQIFYRNIPSGRICACSVKQCLKLAHIVDKSPLYEKSWSLNTTLMAILRPDAELTLCVCAL